MLSKAYSPMLPQVMNGFAEALPAEAVDTLLRRTGKGIALELSRGKRLSGGLKSRVAAASAMLNEHLGALTHVEGNGRIVIRGRPRCCFEIQESHSRPSV